MAIKNWTVIAESTKSTAAREIYINDNNHSNHKNTENIVSIFGNAQTSLNINYQCEKHKLKVAMRRKGGRPPTPAMEFVFTLPKKIRPNQEQWQDMIKRVVRDMARSMGIKPPDYHRASANLSKRSGIGAV